MLAKVREGLAQWRDPEVVRERYPRECERLHIGGELHDLEFDADRGGLVMSLRKKRPWGRSPAGALKPRRLPSAGAVRGGSRPPRVA